MAAFSSLLPLNLLLDIALLFALAASRVDSIIRTGSSLSPATPNGSYWLSPSGVYAFGFFPRSGGYSIGVFMPGIPAETVVWTANRDDPPVPGNSNLQFTDDGRLVLHSTEDTIIAAPSRTADSASMLDSGNFVLYSSGENIVWQSFESPTDTLLGGQQLAQGQELFSAASDNDPSTGIFRIKMQQDGDLVLYPVKTSDISMFEYWRYNTYGSGNTTMLNLSSSGHLYLANGTGYVGNITAGGGYTPSDVIYRARIDPDGIFRLYSYNTTQKGNWSMVWASTHDQCNPKGHCGFNSICINSDLVASCRCLPGFDFVDTFNERSGCQRNLMVDTPVNYSIVEEPQTLLEDNTYSVLSIQAKNECRMHCLQDFNCEAATYQEGECRLQRLPITYAKRNLQTMDTLFVKVKETTASIEGDNQRPEERRKERVRIDILAVSLSFMGLAIVTVIICAILLHQNRVRSYKAIPRGSHHGEVDDVAPRSFTHTELAKVTQDFQEEIGRGSFGIVYRGTMSNGRVIAVKRLQGMSVIDGEREFQTEMKIIGRTHHRNLVRLLGYSLDGPHRILVYEYMSDGSLADLLFASKKVLSWEEKMGIVRNIARGLLYLHEECVTQIIHCDIKPGNILIDEQYRCAKISDFGLSKLLKPDQTDTFTNIRGTRGYVAPEWHKNLPITTRADVYSFGVVLLEIMCSRRNMDQSLPEEEIILEHWVYDCFLAGELHRLVTTEDSVDRRQLERMIKVAIWCTQEEPPLRPSMRKVLLMLEGTVDIPAPPCPTSVISRT